MTKYAVLVEYDLPNDDVVDFNTAAQSLLDALRKLSPAPPTTVTAFAEHAAEQITAFARTV